MKISTDFNYKKTLSQAGEFVINNRIIVTSVVILIVGIIALQRISSLTKPNTDKSHLEKQVTTLEVVNFDEEAIVRINTLRDSRIEIESDFTDRNNPFGE